MSDPVLVLFSSYSSSFWFISFFATGEEVAGVWNCKLWPSTIAN